MVAHSGSIVNMVFEFNITIKHTTITTKTTVSTGVNTLTLQKGAMCITHKRRLSHCDGGIVLDFKIGNY